MDTAETRGRSMSWPVAGWWEEVSQEWMDSPKVTSNSHLYWWVTAVVQFKLSTVNFYCKVHAKTKKKKLSHCLIISQGTFHALIRYSCRMYIGWNGLNYLWKNRSKQKFYVKLKPDILHDKSFSVAFFFLSFWNDTPKISVSIASPVFHLPLHLCYQRYGQFSQSSCLEASATHMLCNELWISCFWLIEKFVIIIL